MRIDSRTTTIIHILKAAEFEHLGTAIYNPGSRVEPETLHDLFELKYDRHAQISYVKLNNVEMSLSLRGVVLKGRYGLFQDENNTIIRKVAFFGGENNRSIDLDLMKARYNEVRNLSLAIDEWYKLKKEKHQQ